MNREELAALRDAIGVILAWPQSVRDQITAWLAPPVAKPNGRDPHTPVLTTTPATPRPARTRHFSAKTAERKLLEAMRDNPNLTVVALANAAGSSRSAAGERLRQMALRGLVEKDATGRWKLKGGEPHPPDPPRPSSS